MLRDTKKAKDLLLSGNFSCVLCRGGQLYTSQGGGISPMLGFIADKTPLSGFSAADKVVGRAAALLFIAAGVREVYAVLASESARSILSEHKIELFADEITAYIKNRRGDGVCPMECAAANITDPLLAYQILSEKLRTLQNSTPAPSKQQL